MNDAETDTLALSFLDLISCGLGAAIFLGLIYSVTRPASPIAASAPSFLDITLEVEDPDAVVNLYVVPPKQRGYVLDLRRLDAQTGAFLAPFRDQHAETKKFRLLGFSPFGEVVVQDPTKKQFLHFSVDEPAPGTWQVEPVFRDKRDWDYQGNKKGDQYVVRVRRQYVVRHLAPSEPEVFEVVLGAGLPEADQTRFKPIEVRGR